MTMEEKQRESRTSLKCTQDTPDHARAKRSRCLGVSSALSLIQSRTILNECTTQNPRVPEEAHCSAPPPTPSLRPHNLHPRRRRDPHRDHHILKPRIRPIGDIIQIRHTPLQVLLRVVVKLPGVHPHGGVPDDGDALAILDQVLRQRAGADAEALDVALEIGLREEARAGRDGLGGGQDDDVAGFLGGEVREGGDERGVGGGLGLVELESLLARRRPHEARGRAGSGGAFVQGGEGVAGRVFDGADDGGVWGRGAALDVGDHGVNDELAAGGGERHGGGVLGVVA